MTLTLKLYNSLSNQKEIFTPLDTNLIKMYVCGPTVYDRPHIGNARSTVIYDILYRILNLVYGKKHVRYVRNITDVDDKIIIRAKELNVTISELTKDTEKYFHDDMKYLNCLSPNIEPRATAHIAEMIDIIQKLIAQGYAYHKNDHVYFDVRKFHDYTKLSGRSLDEMMDGIRITNTEDKNYHGDFVLWKPAYEEDELAKFDSPFGAGRPGWHIECSAMSYRYLGETFDIHGGGVDLIFPHHTNEIAQSRCAFPNSEYAKYWVHNGFLTVNREKMSKSLGNFITVNDLIKSNISGDVARLFLLSNHYKTPLDYNEKAISDSAKMIDYWHRALEKVAIKDINVNQGDLPSDFIDALLDDINTPVAISIINNYAKAIHTSDHNDHNAENAKKLLSACHLIGLNIQPSLNQNITSEIQDLIAKRNIAKQNKDWATSDQIRDLLQEKGIKIEDKPDGTIKIIHL